MQMSDLAHKRRHISFTCGIKIRICIAEGGPITDMFIDSWKYRDNSFYVIKKKSERISVIRSLVLNNRSASVRKTSIFSSTTDWTSIAMAPSITKYVPYFDTEAYWHVCWLHYCSAAICIEELGQCLWQIQEPGRFQYLDTHVWLNGLDRQVLKLAFSVSENISLVTT